MEKLSTEEQILSLDVIIGIDLLVATAKLLIFTNSDFHNIKLLPFSFCSDNTRNRYTKRKRQEYASSSRGNCLSLSLLHLNGTRNEMCVEDNN